MCQWRMPKRATSELEYVVRYHYILAVGIHIIPVKVQLPLTVYSIKTVVMVLHIVSESDRLV
jgi:hypothetical protein